MRPIYSAQTEGRISNALARATLSKHRAHLIGHSQRTGALVFQVWSASHEVSEGVTYYPRAYSRPTAGGYVYTRRAPHYWITCDCSAGQRSQPCHHAGKCALRLEREAAEEKRHLIVQVGA